MTKTNFSRLLQEHPAHTLTQRVAGGLGMAIVLMMTGVAAAQAAPATAATANAPLPAKPIVESGFVVHQTVDLGGHILGLSGSGAMYDTLVNIQSGPRVLGQTITLRAAPGTRHALLDSLTGYSNGFGGDPINAVKLDFSKGKLYEFSGLFRRDRQYFDYDLLGNPNIPAGGSIPIGPSNNPVGHLAWPQVKQSPVMFNTVRRMTDTNLTIFPLSKVTFRVGYSQNIFQGPSLSPGESVGKYDSLLEEYQRNSTDDFLGAVDWKPWQQTKFTFEEQVDHYKADSYFILAPQSFLVQEADGTPVSLGNWDSPTPYGIAGCNTGSMGSGYTSATNYTILSPAQYPGGKPVINPACSAITSYLRSQPTRTLYPTETFRFQSSSIKNIAMNGDFRYTKANSNLPNYYENWNGLDGAIRNATFTGSATAKREEVGFDYGITWELTKKVSLSDQIDFSNVHQPGTATINEVNYNTPTTVVPGNNGYETINYAGTLTRVVNGITAEGSSGGTPLPDYFGQKTLTNNATASWDVSARATLALTYRYRTHTIAEGIPANAPLAPGADSNGTVVIHENGGIFNVALRPTDRWTVNGTAEVLSDDNAFTPIGPRQTQVYRLHSTYRPKTWATVAGSYLDTEHKNNTNNTGTPSAAGPLEHVDHSRTGSIAVDLSPSEHYGFDFTYAYSDVYTSTNICYDAASSSTLPGAASASGTACPGASVRGVTYYEFGPVKDFMDAPTQFATASVTVTPNKAIQGSLGYTISAVSGNQFFNDARAVNGSLQSAYQSPYVHFAWTVHPGWIWKVDYNYYGYGEGGPSGAPLCSTGNPTLTTPATVVPCNSPTLAGLPTGLTEPSSGLTAPRNFHANLVTISMHYEF
jgi:hypothetical protein